MSDEYFRDMEKCHSQGQPEIVSRLDYIKTTQVQVVTVKIWKNLFSSVVDSLRHAIGLEKQNERGKIQNGKQLQVPMKVIEEVGSPR